MNSHYDYLIIGGGPAGTFAAAQIRQNQPSSSLGILTDEAHPLYSRVLLPNFLRDEVRREQVFLRAESFYKDSQIDLITKNPALSLNTADNTVTTANGPITYEKLLIANGGKVRPWGVPGSENLLDIYYLRTIEDADAFKAKLLRSKEALFVGGGFIGLEFMNAAIKHNVKATVLVREEYFWSTLIAAEQAKILTDNLEAKGASIVVGDEATAVTETDGRVNVQTKAGKTISADLVGVGIGIGLQTKWLENSGVAVNRGVVTNEFLETSVPNVWAAGDISEYKDIVLEQTTMVGNWNNAREQGTLVGNNMTATKKPFTYISNYSITSQGLNISFIGSVIKKPEIEVIPRFDVANRRATQLFCHNDKLIGATMINNIAEKASLLYLIQNKLLLADKKTLLADPAADLKPLSS